MLKPHLTHLLTGQPLSAAQAREAFGAIMTGTADAAQVAAMLALMGTREPTVDELVGVARAMREHLVPIETPPGAEVIDTCGTGGVGSKIFNVSTAAAIVAAGCGVYVAKHGNRGITSRTGSSDVLAALGVKVDASPDAAARCLAEAKICFAFAPSHHPSMRHVAAIRKALGFSTIFNLAGPLTNPAGARRQLVGVKSPALAEKMLHALVELGATRVMVVSGQDETGSPLCELSVSGGTYAAAHDGAEMGEFEVTPEQLGMKRWPSAALEVGSPAESAHVIRRVFVGQKGAARDIVVLNAAAALWVAGRVEDLAGGLPVAAAGIDSGAAERTLEKLAAVSNG